MDGAGEGETSFSTPLIPATESHELNTTADIAKIKEETALRIGVQVRQVFVAHNFDRIILVTCREICYSGIEMLLLDSGLAGPRS